MVVPADRLGEQLAEKVGQLRALTDQLRAGDPIRPVLARAQDPAVWAGGPQRVFCGWLDALSGWIRYQLGGALEEVTHLVAVHFNDRASTQAALVAGVPGVTLPPPPRPVGSTPTPPPDFRMVPTRDANPKMDPEQLRSGLAQALGQARDEVLDISRRLDGLLTEPTPNPLPPGIAGPVVPAHELPPDAKQAAGVPDAYLALARELDRATQDVMDRARKFQEAMTGGPATAVPGLAALVADISALSVDVPPVAPGFPPVDAAAPASGVGPSMTAADPCQEGRAAAEEFSRIADRPFFGRGDQRDLGEALLAAEPYADDPLYAAAFVAGFVPEGLRRWCKLAANSVIDLQTTTEIVRPLSHLLGTATRAPGGLDPNVRKTLLDSRCLDTIVQFGAFDADFVVEAAQRILHDPHHYLRVDRSDRVYASVDEKGNYTKGDARYGALQLLANNPGAAQRMVEKDDGDLRMEILRCLEDGGLVGEAAARALEVGLSDLTRKKSVDTLELAIRMTAHGHLHPKGPGKEALARLITQGQLTRAIYEPGLTSDNAEWATDYEGWSVPSQTLAKAFASIVKDVEARAILFAGLAGQANSLLRQQAALVAAADPVSFDESMSTYFETIGRIGGMFRTVGAGLDEADKKKEANAAVVAGLELAIGESAKLLPGGSVVIGATGAAAKLGANWLIESGEEDRLKKLNAAVLKAELRDKLKIFAILNLFNDEKLVERLIPPGSPLDLDLRDEHGRLKIPPLPIRGVGSEAWLHFERRLREAGSPMRKVLSDADLWAETYIQ